MARPKKSLALSTGARTKAYKTDRAEQEERLKVSREALNNAPETLDSVAREEFIRVVNMAADIGILDGLDLGVLAIYANAWSRWNELTVAIAEGGTLVKFGIKMVPNPAIKAQDVYVKQIMACSAKLGLAATDRLKLVVPTAAPKDENPFLRLLKQGER